MLNNLQQGVREEPKANQFTACPETRDAIDAALPEEGHIELMWGNYPDVNRACTKWLRSRGLIYETNPHVVLRGWRTMGDLRQEGGE